MRSRFPLAFLLMLLAGPVRADDESAFKDWSAVRQAKAIAEIRSNQPAVW
jgi:hypothetical protein